MPRDPKTGRFCKVVKDPLDEYYEARDAAGLDADYYEPMRNPLIRRKPIGAAILKATCVAVLICGLTAGAVRLIVAFG